ncbi:MAG: adenylate/guanylate cyclase domain-containing protein [Candidatus Promineifilaceae bacterium]
MKKVCVALNFLLLISFFGSRAAQAQDPADRQTGLDSLLTVWNDSTRQDSDRVNAFKEYIWTGYLYSRPDTAGLLAEALHAYAQEHHYPEASARGYLLQGIANWFQGLYPPALECYRKSSAIYEQLGDVRGISSCLSGMGSIYKEQGNYPLALEYFQKNLSMEEALNDKMGIAGSLNNIGNIYKNQDDLPRALEYYQKSLALKEELGDKRGTAGSLHNIGIIYDRQGDYPLALSYYEKARAINEETGHLQWLSNNLSNIGIIHKEQGNYPLALEYFQRCLEIDEALGNKEGISASLNNIGFVHLKQGKYTLAQSFCEKGLALATDAGVLEWQMRACECLYHTYKDLGKGSEALKYHEQMIAVRDSIYNDENTEKITRLEMQYDFDKKEAATTAEQEKKDAIAAQELKRQKLVRNGFVGGFAVVLLFAGVFFVQRNRIGKEKERSEELLLNILPEEVAEELKDKGHSDAQLIDHVTVLFTDFKGFTALSELVTPKELVADLHECFSAFDRICEKYGIEKIKTIGDAYMAAGGLPTPNRTHATDVVKAALEMAEVVEQGKAKKLAKGQPFFEVRIGVHTGPVVAGIVGIKKFQYDIWGDTVNTASRMESSGEVGKVNISENTYAELKADASFSFTSRGKIIAKGKGEMGMYFVSKT